MTDVAPLSLDDAIARVTAVLDDLRAVQAAPLAAVNPDGTPGHVAAGELIESAWGNATADSITKLMVQRATAWEGSTDVGLQGVPIGSFGTFSVFTFSTAPLPLGLYLVTVSAYFETSAASSVNMHGAVDGTWISAAAVSAKLAAGTGTTITDTGIINLAPASHTVQAIAQCTVAGMAIAARTATAAFLRTV